MWDSCGGAFRLTMPTPPDEVLIVPCDRRLEMLEKLRHVRIENPGGDWWDELTEEEAHLLSKFLLDSRDAILRKSWQQGPNLRLGYTNAGVYLHRAHIKRYFGILRSEAGILLNKAVPEAVPLFAKKGSATDKTLAKVADAIPTLSDDMRHHILRVTFKAADVDGNGVLTKSELSSMFRKIVPSLSAQDMTLFMDQVDKDNNDKVSYDEFVNWMQKSAPEKIKAGVRKSLSSEADIVRVSFRVWDKNGDGMIVKSEIIRAMRIHCKDLTSKQINALVKVIDTDNDGKIDYDEFVDFLFHRK